MNVRQKLQMDKPEFLAWIRAREGRYELAGGRVVMMTGGFPPGPNVLEGHDARIGTAALGIDLPLSEIHAGIATS